MIRWNSQANDIVAKNDTDKTKHIYKDNIGVVCFI